MDVERKTFGGVVNLRFRDTFKRRMRTVSFSLLLSIICATTAHAAFIRPLSSGRVYPTLPDAVAMNPAAMSDERDAAVGRLFYDDKNGYAAMYAKSWNNSGLGLGLNPLGAGTLTLAWAFGGESFHIGINGSMNGTLSPGDSGIGLSMSYGKISGFRIMALMTSVLKSESNNVVFGFGYAQAKNYQVELTFKTAGTTFTGPGLIYTTELGATKFWESIGLGAFVITKTGYKPVALSSPDMGGALQYLWNSNTSFDFKYVQNGSMTLGFLSKF